MEKKMTLKEKKKFMDGHEYMSLEHEGVVYINGDYGHCYGRKFKLTGKDIKILWEVMLDESSGHGW
tara:strand:+ start:635 stop:832 length:198 start_codon:yes stop_codon:yes gene_type:complete